MATSPPHVLFGTTEMLNRALADSGMREVFTGRSNQQRPRILLLDEVHTYSGTHGAHVALLIRRWRHAIGRRTPLHVVGLSATLENPTEFMEILAGEQDVHQISPAEDDLELRGAEYAVVLRGNPVSGSALLSTTIQSTFLMARLLEGRSSPDPTGTSGSKVFAFTDDLDVTNRLYWDIRSAEGLQGKRRTTPLAALRSPTNDGGGTTDRRRDGQVWDIAPQLGHPLGSGDRLEIARTSSQDAGVDPTADVIVATSSLEVGFDDPEVAAIVQHKAPRDDAAFVQRKGRAGRRPEMRPWTVVVLSDFGRDRARYQGYESLFSPTLASRSLPLDNLHVLRMQAALSLLDWLVLQHKGLRARLDLSAPADGPRRGRQRRVAATLQDVLTDARRQRDLERHLKYALDIDDEQLLQVMWTPPRAIMTSAIPTMLRRLESNWQTVAGTPDRYASDVPLPDHAPRALFSDLNLPEVRIIAPGRKENQDSEHWMPIVQALSEFPPARVSRRFAVAGYTLWHWIPLPEVDSAGRLVAQIEDFSPGTELIGHLTLPQGSVPLRRPWTVTLSLADRDEQSTNAQPNWASTLVPTGTGWRVELPFAAPGSRVIEALTFHTHSAGNAVTVSRGVIGSTAQSKDGIDQDVGLQDADDQPVALGFSGDHDAVSVTIRPGALPGIADLAADAARGARAAWFEDRVANDPPLRGLASRFSLTILSQLYLASVAGVTLAKHPAALPDITAATATVRELGIATCVERSLNAVFVADLEEDDDDPRGVARLRALIRNSDVEERLGILGQLLCDGDHKEFDPYVRQASISTLGAAVREAFQRLCPNVDVESLVIDSNATGEHGANADLWLTEPQVGSGGTIDEIRRTLGDDPARFGRLLQASLGPGDYEIVDHAVRRAMTAASEVGPMAAAFDAVRKAADGRETAQAVREVRSALRDHGLPSGHAVVAALSLRVLRPGSTPATDNALLAALELWEDAEQALGIELDARSVAYAASRVPGASLNLEQIYSLLWPRGRTARAATLNTHSRFTRLVAGDRLLLSHAIADPIETVSITGSTVAEAKARLAQTGRVRLRSESSSDALQRAAQSLLATPIEVGSIMSYPRTTGAEVDGTHTSIDLELPEALR